MSHYWCIVQYGWEAITHKWCVRSVHIGWWYGIMVLSIIPHNAFVMSIWMRFFDDYHGWTLGGVWAMSAGPCGGLSRLPHFGLIHFDVPNVEPFLNIFLFISFPFMNPIMDFLSTFPRINSPFGCILSFTVGMFL